MKKKRPRKPTLIRGMVTVFSDREGKEEYALGSSKGTPFWEPHSTLHAKILCSWLTRYIAWAEGKK